MSAASGPLNYINGQRVESSNSNTEDDITVVEPATGKVLASMRSCDASDVNAAVNSAREAFKGWSQLSGMQRGKLLTKASQIMRLRRDEFARMDTINTGKPIWEGRSDTDGCIDTLEFYAGLASSLAGDHVSLPDGSWGYTRREPLGVVGAIGAWNYPLQMAVWKSSPALAAGNTVVFKPSPLTPLTAVMLAEVYVEAGLPPGVFNVVQGGASTGQLLSSHPLISKMSFTGSVASGSKVMQACAEGIKHVTLELGGKSPIIIFEDADVDNAVKGTMMANFLSQGEVCSNGTRVFVHEDIWDQFVSALVEKTKAMKIGNPLSEETTGARVMCGGERVIQSDAELRDGYFLSPCILTDVTDDMEVAREEIFGSVACLFPFSTEEEVIRRANDTPFGLAGGVFTQDLRRAHRVVAALEAGSIYINNYNVYPCELPFGGYKRSGIGRENGARTLDFYTQLKSVYVEMGDVWCPL